VTLKLREETILHGLKKGVREEKKKVVEKRS
jgi:hypothetical protein